MEQRPELSEWELAGVSGGSAGETFARIEEQFAISNDCSSCRRKAFHRNYEMCLPMYDKLLQAYTLGESIDMHCSIRD